MYEIRKILEAEPHPDGEVVKGVFDQVSEARARWLAGEATAKARMAGREREEMPGFAESMGEMFMGRKLLQAQKRILGGGKDKEKDRR